MYKIASLVSKIDYTSCVGKFSWNRIAHVQNFGLKS